MKGELRPKPGVAAKNVLWWTRMGTMVRCLKSLFTKIRALFTWIYLTYIGPPGGTLTLASNNLLGSRRIAKR